MESARPTARTSVLGLIKALTHETKTLIRQEVKLAKTEISEKVSKAARNSAALGVGGFMAYAGLIVFLLGLGLLVGWAIHLAGIQALFASFLGLAGIGLLVLAAGGVVLLKSLRSFSKESLAPERTLHTLHELKQRDPQGRIAYEKKRQEEKVSSLEMQSRVEATEGELGATLDELGHQLSPAEISAKMKRRIQADPYRTSLIAMGIGLVTGFLLRRRFRPR
jgi:hypothetical protein